MSVETLASKMEVQARLKPASTAAVEVLAAAQLFLRALEDEDVGVHGHAHREDEGGDAGQRQGDGHELEDGQGEDAVGDEREAGHDARHAVVEQHEGEHEDDADQAREDGLVEEVQAQRGADAAEADLADLQWQRAEAQHGHEVVGLVDREVATDLRLPAEARGVDRRCGLDDAVKDDGEEPVAGVGEAEDLIGVLIEERANRSTSARG